MSSTSVEGSLRGRQQMDYEAPAAAGQTLTVRLSARPPRTIALKLYSPAGAQMALRNERPDRWTAALPEAGDYGISVARTSHTHGTSSYKLTVSIR